MCSQEKLSSSEESDDGEQPVPAVQSNSSEDSDVSMSESENEMEETNTTAEAEPTNDEDEEENEVLKAIKRENTKVRNHPPTIKITDDVILDICFHPTEDILAIANDVGDVIVYKYSNEENTIVNTFELHTKACRDIELSEDGKTMFSASKDKSIMLTDFETGNLKKFYDDAHESPLYCIKVINEHIFATGDDDGVVKLWDSRIREDKAIFSIKKNEDYISDLITDENEKYLVCSSGDGSLTTIDLQTRRFVMQSEEYEEELNCLGLFKRGTKLLAGSSKGNLFLYNWREFGLHSDVFAGSKKAINCLIPITENIVVTGSEDGNLRAVHLFPHRYLGIVGQHEFTVEKLDISNNGKFIASSSCGDDVRFWNIEYFEELQSVGNKHSKHNKSKEMQHNLPSSKHRNVAEFFQDLN